MKLISLNLSIKNKSLQKVADFLDAQDADIVVMQEVLVDDKTDAAKIINSLMDHPYETVNTVKVETYTTSKGETYTQGQSIMTKAQESLAQRIELSSIEGDKHERIAQRSSMDYYCTEDRDSVCYSKEITNVHFGNRSDSWKQLREIIDKNNQAYVNSIIVGDFNMKKETLLQNKTFWGAQFESSAEFMNYTSFPTSADFPQIDFCLIPVGMKFLNITTYEGLSDHNAVVYEIDDSNERDIFSYIYPREASRNIKL